MFLQELQSMFHHAFRKGGRTPVALNLVPEGRTNSVRQVSNELVLVSPELVLREEGAGTTGS